MKSYIFYFVIRGQDLVYCIAINPVNQISTDHTQVKEFKTDDPDDLLDFIQHGFYEAWEHVPAFKNKPEWQGASFREIELRSQEVRPGSYGDGGVIPKEQMLRKK